MHFSLQFLNFSGNIILSPWVFFTRTGKAMESVTKLSSRFFWINLKCIFWVFEWSRVGEDFLTCFLYWIHLQCIFWVFGWSRVGEDFFTCFEYGIRTEKEKSDFLYSCYCHSYIQLIEYHVVFIAYSKKFCCMVTSIQFYLSNNVLFVLFA